MSESSAPAAAVDEPVAPERPTPGRSPSEQAVSEQAASEQPTEVIAAVEEPPPGRHRRADGARTIVLSARTMAFLRLARTVGPLALVAVTLAACTTSSAPPAPPTARVERAAVTTAVSSSGSLAAVTEQNLGFTKAGQIKTVDVKVGQKVTAGQVLAAIDDAPARRILAQQQGELDSQRAALARQVNATTVGGARNTTNQAQDILAATRDQASETVDADKSAIDRAEKQLDFDKDARDDAEDQADDAKSACASSGGSSSGSSGSSIDTSAILAGLGSTDSDSDSDSAEEKRKKLEAALKAAGALAGSLGSSSAGASSACTQAASAQSALAAADRQVEASRTALDAAKNRRDVDEAAGRLQVENAQQGVVTAQNNLTSASTDRPSLIAQQRGVVTAQEAIVRQAQQDVDDAVLRAPADGTVAAVNGAVGEFLTAGSTTTPLAPGSGGAIPGAAAATAGGGAAGAVARPGGTQFIVLDNVDRFEVVVPFEESDAVKITPNQKVNVSFDAIPDLTLPGTVTAVSPSATALSGVISYYATVALAQGDPRLKNGQTAQAAVLTTELDDVLTVPNSAVHRQGDKTTVTVQQFDGQRTVEFQAGVVGDDRTQVLSGLTVGDEVVVPSGR
ncbi:MAG: HlyD family secretion protein [Pseudonocardiales bacterium]|nr:HlyD family secretion protein [Pseudonocardiales bacterium]